MDQLADSIVHQARLTQRGHESTLHMRLEPPALGGLEVRVSVDQTGVRIAVTAERLEAHQALQQALPSLTTAISDRGIAIQRADVWLNNAALDLGGQQQQRSWHGGDPRPPRWGPAAGSTPAGQPEESSAPSGSATSIDLRV